MATSLAVLGSGLVSGVGLTTEECCAAIRCGINNFESTRFIGRHGDWLIGSPVTLDAPRQGLTHLARMAAASLQECFQGEPPNRIPVLLCVAEAGRPGRDPLINDFLLRE